MRWRVYFLLVFLGLFAIPASLAHADLQAQYLQIYLNINTAQNLEKSGDFVGALNTYKDCYTKLAKIHRDAPDWEKALVLSRLADCKAKVDLLTLKVQSMPPQQPPPAPPTPPVASETNTAPVAPVPVPAMEQADTSIPDDIPALKKRLAEVEEQLRLTKDNLRDSQTQVDTYRARLETVNQQLQALTSKQSADDRVGRLLTENKSLTDKLSAAEKQLDEFKKNPKSRLAQVETQLKSVQDQLEATQGANTTLQQSFTSLQQRYDENQAALIAANQKLAAVNPNSPDYATVKRENEMMRAMMQRELQEQARRDEARRLYQEEFNALKIKSSKLQEEFDNMTTPPFPPTTDDERTLLNSLKVTAVDINPPSLGNGFSAPAAGTENGTNAAPANPPDVANPSLTGGDPNAGAMADASLTPGNAPAIKSDDTSSTPPPAPPTPPAAPDSSAPTPPQASVPAPTQTATNAPDVSTPGPVPPDGATNATPPAPAPPVSTSTVSTPPISNPPVPPPPAPPTPPVETVAENTAKTAAPADTQPSNNPPTVTNVPPGTTTVTTTTVTPGGGDNSKQPDPSEWANKARLPEDMRDTAQQASDFFNMKRYDEAAAKYQTIIDKYPESLYAWSNLGVVRFQQGDLNDALKALQQAVKISPTDSFSYSNLGIVYYNLNQYENAIDALNAAKQLDPKDAKIRNYLGCACSQKGWEEVAEKEFRAAIEIDPNFPDPHFNLALLYATEKPPALELARTEYNKALELGIQKDDRLEKLLQPK